MPGELKETTASFSWYISSIVGNIYTWAGSFAAADVNTGKIVTGSTNDVVNRTLSYSRTGCTPTYTLIQGAITFKLTNKDPSTTTVFCNPSSILAGSSTIYTATVVDSTNSSSIPSGTIHFTIFQYAGITNSGGKCTLSAGSCSVKFAPGDEATGTFLISAAFSGNSTQYKSSESTLVYVTSN